MDCTMNDNQKPSYFRGLAIVGFIDILGFAKDTTENWDKSWDENTLKKLFGIKKYMDFMNEKYAESFRKHGFSNELSDCVQINSISDSFVIRRSFYPFNENIAELSSAINAGAINEIIRTITSIWYGCIENGYTVRGGIDIENAYWDDRTMTGPALINAYKLEVDIAKNSRIIMSSNVNRELENIFKTSVQSENASTIQALSECLIKDVDGYIIINPKIIFEHERDIVSGIRKLEQMKDTAGKGIIREKYTPIINILKSDSLPSLTAEDFGNY